MHAYKPWGKPLNKGLEDRSLGNRAVLVVLYDYYVWNVRVGSVMHV
jgi:hypothetical protein